MADIFEDPGAAHSSKKLAQSINRIADDFEGLEKQVQRTAKSAGEAEKSAKEAEAAARRLRREAAARAGATPVVGGGPAPPSGSYRQLPPGAPPPRQIGGGGYPARLQLPPGRVAGYIESREARQARSGPDQARFFQGNLAEARVNVLRAERLQIPQLSESSRARLAGASTYAEPRGAQLPPGGYIRNVGPGLTQPVGVTHGNATAESVQRVNKAYAEGIRLNEQYAASQYKIGQAYSQSAVAIGAAGDQYRKNGALTTEFIGAAGRGEVTIRELGYQVGATIGKFAGWTAAATLVYGAVSAFGALYQGALKAADGVTQVQRVASESPDSGALTQSFRDLSNEFNVPIADTADTVYQLTKLFGGDLPSAIEASRVSLQALQVGELDITKSTNALNSVVKGFGLTAADLQQVFDAVNQAQNKFGGNTGTLLENIGKGAAQARQAGLDYKDLIGLQQVVVQYGGRTPSVAQTAISRSIQRTLTEPGREALKGVGIDPNLGYIEKLQSAAAKYATASAEGQQAIARALVPAGGQFAPVISALLADIEKWGVVRKAVDDDAENAKTRQKELSTFLSSPSQQIKALTVDLQNLGSALGDSGALAPLAGLVTVLDKTLELTTQLLEAFNALPGPLNKAVLPLLEMYGIFRLLKRFDTGSLLTRVDGSQGFIGRGLRRSPGAVANATIVQGIRDRRTLVDEEIRGTQGRLGRTQLQRTIAEQQYGAAAVAYGAGPSAVAEKKLLSAKAKVASLTETEAQLIADRDLLVAEGKNLELQGNTYRSLRNKGLSAEAAAAEANILYRRSSLDIPNTLDPTRPIPPGGTATPSGIILPASAATQYTDDAARAAAEAEKAAQVQSKAAQASGFWGKAGQQMRGAGSRIRQLGGFINRYLSEALIVGLVAFEVYSLVKDDLDKTEEQFAGQGGTPGQLRKQAEGIKISYADKARGLLSKIPNTPYNPYTNFIVDTEGLKEENRERLFAEAEAIEKAQKGSKRDPGKRRALLTTSQIRASLKEDLGAARGIAERKKVIEEALYELDHSYAAVFGGKGAKKAAANLLADVKNIDPKNLPDEYGGLESKEAFEKAQALYEARTSLAVSRAKTPGAGISIEIARIQKSLPGIIDTYTKNSVEYVSAIQEIEDLRKKKFEAAQALIDTKTAAYVAGETDPVAALRYQLTKNAEKIEALVKADLDGTADYIEAIGKGKELRKSLVNAQLSQFQAQVGLQTSQANAGAGQGEQLRNAVSAAQQILAKARQLGGSSPEELTNLAKQVQDAKNSYADFLKQEARSLIDANAALATARTEDPAKEGRIELNRLRAQAKYAETPAEKKNALAQIREQQIKIRNDRQQQIADDIEFELSIGKITEAQAIERYEKLRATMHGNKQLNRQIQQRIKALKNEADSQEFDLEVGSLKLPTIYDVRRAFDPIREQVKASAQARTGGKSFLKPAGVNGEESNGVTTNTTVNVYVNDKNDAPVVYDAVDRAVRTNVRARMRSRKLR